MSKAAVVLVWLLVIVAFVECAFVVIPFFAQGVHEVQLQSLVAGRPHYDFLGDFGYVVAVLSQTFGYSLLGPLVAASVLLGAIHRKPRRVAASLCAVLPWVIMLPHHARLVEWMWP